jgi:hypothetical protein
LSLPIAFGLSGCTPAQREANTLKTTVKSASAVYNSCTSQVLADQSYLPLRSHIPLDSFLNATVEQMESDDYPSQQDIQLISQLSDNLTPCRQQFIAVLDTVPGDLGAPFENYDSTEQQSIIILSQGHSTWGQFVQVMHTAAVQRHDQGIAALGQLDSQLQAENAVEVAQRQQALQNYSNYMQRQQEINAVNNAASRPVNTTCNQMGTQTNCTSY